jgi:photosystem II stability/assembly factor-like uncharacterized protein
MRRVVFLTVILVSFWITGLNAQLGWYFQNSGTSAQLNSIKFFNGNTAWAAGWTPNILKTTNGGLNWIAKSTGNSASYQHLHFANSLTGWAVGSNGTIIKTTNGGENWVAQNSGSGNLLMYVNFINAQTGWIVGYSGVLLNTTNGGLNWIAKSSGTTSNLLCVYFINLTTGFFSGDSGIVKKTTNGGISWVQKQTPVNYNLDKFFFINSNTGWVSGINGTVLKTTNSGNNWLFTYTGITSWITAVHFFDVNTGYACGGEYGNPYGGIILKSINGGNSWVPTTHPPIPWMAFMSFVSSDTGWAVGQNGFIMKTVDGGYPIPLAPILVYPTNNMVIMSLTPTLSWNSSAGATRYSYQVLNGSNIVDSGSTPGFNKTIPSGKLQYGIYYQWKVKAHNEVGSSPWSSTWSFVIVVDNLKNISSNIPDKFELYQNFPNPFNPSTKIRFDIPKSSDIKLKIFDVSGREIENIFNGNISPGAFEYTWNAASLTSGVYFARLESKDYVGLKKMILVK